MPSPFAAVNHIGFVVADLERALTFFTDLLGFTAIEGRSGSIEPDGDALTRRFGIHPDASGRYAFVQMGDAVIELLAWTAPDQNIVAPLNSDRGGRHLAISVTDMASAVERLRKVEGVDVREPNDMGYVYCATPFGLELQLIPI
jgi:catechol 2,3-dioxygenase-like lactoylglutathione lyase family enzyme